MAVNGVLIKASAFNNREELVALCQPFHFENVGNEQAETMQLHRQLKWKTVDEAGKFYDDKGAINWYWYVYGQGNGGSLPLNPAATKACGRRIKGDVMVVRSGPADATYSPIVSVDDVVDSILYYVNGKDPGEVFAEREKARMCVRFGVDPSKVAHISMGAVHPVQRST